jgi:hypothetical protein
MQFGVSYFGVRNPQHFQHDLEDIVGLGFTSIICTFSEEDHRFSQSSLAESVRRTQQQGRKACIDPWGVCGVFGGGALSERGAWDLEGQQRRSDGRPLPLLCPNSAEVRTYLQRWITSVAEVLQADAIFWDEPHFYIPFIPPSTLPRYQERVWCATVWPAHRHGLPPARVLQQKARRLAAGRWGGCQS